MSEQEKINKNMKEKQGIIRDLIILGVISIVTLTLLYIFPDKKEPVLSTSWNFFIEMMLILPAVMVMLGLFAVWVPKDIVVRYLGKTSGVKGIFLAIILGTLPTGPLYIAFPIASALLKKGAKISNIVVFLSAWACIKVPQEMVELQFLGVRFMLSRLSLTIIFVVIMGIFIEKVLGWKEVTENGC
ncbi:permease [Archaeoglobus sp.]|uniref:permease n=1 Tax=Archaeoglobus sp. TaxID=1872626 RepID=UPI0025BE86C2|nr:permease [Archaeoglobus sp.]